MCFIKELNKSLNKICKSNKIYINTIKDLIELIIIILLIFCMFGGTMACKTYSTLLNVIDDNSKVINVIKSKKYKRYVSKNHLRGYKKINKYNGVHYMKLSSQEKLYLNRKLPNKTEITIMMESVRYGFRDTLSLCIANIILIILYSKFIDLEKHKSDFFHKIGPVCSIQIISAISVYSIVLNFVTNAPIEPDFIIGTIIFMIATMCTTFVVYTASSLMSTKDIIKLLPFFK